MDRNAVLMAVGGCLEEVFRGALAARGIPAGPEALAVSWEGEWNATGELTRVHMRFRLQAEERHRATVDRVLGFYAAHCPLKKKLAPRAVVASGLIFEPLPQPGEAGSAPPPAS